MKIGGEIGLSVLTTVSTNEINTSDLGIPLDKLPYWIATSTGRNSLALALQDLKKKNHNRLYCPAFICDSVIQTAKQQNYEISYYDICDDFSPDLKDVRPDGVFLLVHYFGWLNRGSAKLKHNKDAILEDAVQAAFTKGIGHFGNCLFTSYRKFTESPDGSILASTRPIYAELEPALESFINSRIEGKNLKLLGADDRTYLNLFEQSEASLDNDSKIRRISNIGAAVLERESAHRIAARRVENFRFLSEALSKVAQVQLPFTHLEADVVPLGLPLLIGSHRNPCENTLTVMTFFARSTGR